MRGVGVDAEGKKVKMDVLEETLYLLLVDPQVRLCRQVFGFA